MVIMREASRRPRVPASALRRRAAAGKPSPRQPAGGTC